mmetsp:Transcript_17723/g.24323  ORF Transcript_17723/g.24323 Transcript_17723/m.24323 type:complete len:84 (-) Transcript_17723:351-602(-)|eukprot:CAMPEP_0170082998 /NCGR_PEP_ID=MMETSP0019_2-20121128/18419_1 /TAXON_ID=98059 /ORGANISM="Dinobryon sp., Strain UTEXLB2267" /LENGTH=83 /DNA_ID=CAMNT_0010298095 /DNA_START=1493 /DNA_END=1744 /DNA_ORIENTATION=-
MDATLIGLRALSTAAKMMFPDDAIVIYPDTESIKSDIDRDERLGVLIPYYSSLKSELDKPVIKIAEDPRFNQLSSRDLNIAKV